MSIAGIHSNRGDNYQTLIAFDWALTVLSEPAFQWLEIESTAYPVDDIVIGKSDGSLICCQCKKNQTDFRAWSIAGLADELGKASRLLAGNPQAQVRFYSRNNFGKLAKLREYSIPHGNEAGYRANLTGEHTKTDGDLAAHEQIGRIEKLAGIADGRLFQIRDTFPPTSEAAPQTNEP